ncbi:MAG: DUF3344 domain-containing protein [Methanophagales archaeon ANME-1-THS]|nr:MAG: DUF3344 domain-containing protein [Methanophagales archaeon ANME-1-THS]
MRFKLVMVLAIAWSCVLLLCTPVLAVYEWDGFPVETRERGTVNGGVFIGYEPWASTKTLTGTFKVPDGNVEWARLYTGIWGGTEKYAGWVEVTFNGYELGLLHLQGESDTNPNVWCSGHGKHWISFDVENLVESGSRNTATVTTINATQGSFDGRIYGIVLVVVYEGGDDPKEIQYWINDGSDGLNYKTPHDWGRTYFDGKVDTKGVNAKLTLVHLTAYDPPCSDCVQFNGNTLDTSMVDSNNFELNTWDVTPSIKSEDNYAWYSRGEDGYVSVTNAILIVEKRSGKDTSDLLPTAIKPYHYAWEENKNLPRGEPWFNLTNYVNVTVENQGSDDAGRFMVNLYADDTLLGTKTVEGLRAGDRTDLKFEWRPMGRDPLSWKDTAEGARITYTDTSKTYKLRVVVDPSDAVLEADEKNNELIQKQKVVWNGYMADEPLTNYLHGSVNGGLLYTTGNAYYRLLGSGAKSSVYNLEYELAIPGSTKLARVYIPYTWAKPEYKAPKIGVTLTTPSGKTRTVALEKSYNDIKGDFGAFRYAWGLYTYNLTDVVTEPGTYGVRLSNLNKGDKAFATEFAVAAPAILVVYENQSEPKREYWLNEGADILIGGRRDDGGFLAADDSATAAVFAGSIDLNLVETAIIGLVSPWADSSEDDDIVSFNGNELGKGLYCGYEAPCTRTADGLSMIIGARDAQVGIAAREVTQYLNKSTNRVIQSDDGDNMMPTNAFLVITYATSPTSRQTPRPTAPSHTSTTATPVPTQAITPPPPSSAASGEAPSTAAAPIPGFELLHLVAVLMLMLLVRTIRGGGRRCE